MTDQCTRCARRELVPSFDDIAAESDKQFHMRAMPLQRGDAGPCVVFALPDGVALRWCRLTPAQALQLAAELERAVRGVP